MDRLAGLVARGATKRNAALAALNPDVIGHEPLAGAGPLDPFAGLSRPKRAILAAVADMFGLLGAGEALPWKVRPLVGMLQSTQPMLVTTVAGMDEAEVRRILTLVGDRITDALTEDAAPVITDQAGQPVTAEDLIAIGERNRDRLAATDA